MARAKPGTRERENARTRERIDCSGTNAGAGLRRGGAGDDCPRDLRVRRHSVGWSQVRGVDPRLGAPAPPRSARPGAAADAAVSRVSAAYAWSASVVPPGPK